MATRSRPSIIQIGEHFFSFCCLQEPTHVAAISFSLASSHLALRPGLELLELGNDSSPLGEAFFSLINEQRRRRRRRRRKRDFSPPNDVSWKLL
jgi:hypothetical protein